MKKIFILLFLFSVSLYAQFEFNQTPESQKKQFEDLIKAEITPCYSEDPANLDTIKLIIKNNSKDAILLTTEPYFLYDAKLCERILGVWLWPWRSFTNVILLKIESDEFGYSGDGTYKVNFNTTTKLLCVQPEDKIEIIFEVQDTIKKLYKNNKLNIFAFISFGKYGDIYSSVCKDEKFTETFNKYIIFEKQYKCELVPLVNLQEYNDKSPDSFWVR